MARKAKAVKEKEEAELNQEKEREYKCCRTRTTVRTPEEKRSLINRINRAAGQINGIKGMLEQDAYCTDLLVQVAAVNAAMNAFCKLLVENHLTHCVAEDLKANNTDSLEEFIKLLQKFMY